MSRRTFEHIRAGDVVCRMLAGQIPLLLRVSSVDDELIHCGPPGVGWSFDRATGAEVDRELSWGPQYGITGSYLVHAVPADAVWEDDLG